MTNANSATDIDLSKDDARKELLRNIHGNRHHVRSTKGDRRQRRRRWSVDQKLCMVAQSKAPGWSAYRVAKLYGIAPCTIYNWRNDFSAGKLIKFGPVTELVSPDAGSNTNTNASTSDRNKKNTTVFDIKLPSGAKIRIKGTVDETLIHQIRSILQ